MAGLVFVADKLSVHLRTGRKMSGFQLLGGMRRSCNKMLFAFPQRTAQVQIPPGRRVAVIRPKSECNYFISSPFSF